MCDLVKPALIQDKAYWIEYVEKLEVEIAGKESVIKDLHNQGLEEPDKDYCYLKAYRAGWNDALHELAIDGAEELKTRLWIFANKMKRK